MVYVCFDKQYKYIPIFQHVGHHILLRNGAQPLPVAVQTKPAQKAYCARSSHISAKAKCPRLPDLKSKYCAARLSKQACNIRQAEAMP